jgi:GINS complex subunit 1
VRQVVTEVNEHDSVTRRITARYEQPSDQDNAMSSSSQQPVTADSWSSNLDAATSVVVHVQSAIRNKKMLLAYTMQRMERLKSIRWTQRTLPSTVSTNCSPTEVDFFRAYDRLLNSYMSSARGVGLDLTLDTKPPKANNVLVKVMASQGELLFSFGNANLQRGTVHLLPVEEAEPLIKAGAVEPYDPALCY